MEEHGPHSGKKRKLNDEDVDGRSAQLRETCRRGQIIARRAINVSQESILVARSFLAAISEPNIDVQDIATAASNLTVAVRNLATAARNAKVFTRDMQGIDGNIDKVIRENYLHMTLMFREATRALATAALEIQNCIQESLSFAKCGA
jgi:hypothetical protein